MRQRRRALTPRERQQAGQALARVLGRSRLFQRSQRVALFFAADGEIDTAPLIQLAWRRNKQVYLPVLRPFGPNRLWFRRYRPDSALITNRFGIAEPPRARGSDLAPRHLDLVLTPLVAFDRHGHRLGMGGGYYDRTFSFLHQRRQWQQPRLIGLAYAFQEVDALPAEPWDVPLWGVATETDLHRFSNA